MAQSYRDCGGINKDGRPNWDVIAEAKGRQMQDGIIKCSSVPT